MNFAKRALSMTVVGILILAPGIAGAQQNATPPGSAGAGVTPNSAQGARPAPVSPRTTTGEAPAQPSGPGHLPNGNPERPPTSTNQTHEPPAK
jgi:hypothetical protein